MHGLFIYDAVMGTGRTRVVFCSGANLNEANLIGKLQTHAEAHPPPNKTHFLIPHNKEVLSDLIAATESSSFQSRFAEATRYLDPPEIRIMCFGADGAIQDNATKQRVDVEETAQVGLREIFERRRGMLTAEHGYHYVKPSGKHSESFIRIGNLMISSAEIEFMAFCCLPKVPINTRQIYLDTGDIYPVAQAVCQLRDRLGDETEAVAIDSFGSFSGLADFEFQESESSLVLISASTSGGLERKIASAVPSLAARIVTLFYLGKTPPPNPLQVVCDLGKGSTNGIKAYDPFESYDDGSCSLCDRGWTRVGLEGDQFLPGASRIEPVILKVAHSPGKWLSEFVRQVKGRGIIKAHYSDQPGSDRRIDVFFDIERMFSEGHLDEMGDLSKKFQWMIDQNVPLTTTRVIHLDDPASRRMAQKLVENLSELNAEIECLSMQEIMESDSSIRNAGSTVVVASAVSSGRSLHAVSLQLRQIQRNNAFHYLVGIVRCPSQRERDELRSNLAFGPYPHGFWFMQELFLPLAHSQRPNAWEMESEFLKRFREINDSEGLAVLIEERIEELNEASRSDVKGLANELFLKSGEGRTMMVRQGFAFLDFEFNGGEISQAETFFVISSVLHHMRNTGSLRQHDFVRRILSPRCFDRFNDGAIQASILRAALPTELDYSTNERLSREMRSVLEVMLRNSSTEVGEAAREFMLALSTRRMQLTKTDCRALCSEIHTLTSDPFCNALARALTVTNDE